MKKVILYSIMMLLFLEGLHVEEVFCQKKAEEYNIVEAICFVQYYPVLS